ncbi:(2Fe-2S) ferredoxin domain-containing protein [Tuwongella immobilis]|nr:ferredoxin [Tuwongella immobilis]
MSESTDPKLAEIANKLCIGSFYRHVLLCIGETCCDSETGNAAWELLKRLLKDHQLSLSTAPGACYRTKVGCLRVCIQGPILVVYPEGTWYANMTVERIPRFVQEHLIEGREIPEWIFARNPLPLVQESAPRIELPRSDG